MCVCTFVKSILGELSLETDVLEKKIQILDASFTLSIGNKIGDLEWPIIRLRPFASTTVERLILSAIVQLLRCEDWRQVPVRVVF